MIADKSISIFADSGPLLNSLPVGVVIHSSDTTILYANPRALELLRQTEAQALGRQALLPEWDLIDENGKRLEAHEYPVNRVLASGADIQGVVIGIVDQTRPEPTWINLQAFPQRNAEDELQVVVVFIDISDRLRIPFRRIVDQIDDAIVITEGRPIDPPGPRIIYVNEAFEKMTGYLSKDIIGKTPRILQGEHTDRAELDKIRLAMETDQHYEGTLLNYRKDGQPFWLEMKLSSLTDYMGHTKFYICAERDITDRVIEHRQLKNAAEIDALTGIYNRRAFLEQASMVWSKCKKAGAACSAISIDIDHFKAVNDLEGHSAGDQVLREFGLLLSRIFRHDDICGRVGGEEFIVILPNASVETALASANRLRISAQDNLRTPQNRIVTISAGVAQFRENESIDAFMHRIDELLYLAKKSSRNIVCKD